MLKKVKSYSNDSLVRNSLAIHHSVELDQPSGNCEPGKLNHLKITLIDGVLSHLSDRDTRQ